MKHLTAKNIFIFLVVAVAMVLAAMWVFPLVRSAINEQREETASENRAPLSAFAPAPTAQQQEETADDVDSDADVCAGGFVFTMPSGTHVEDGVFTVEQTILEAPGYELNWPWEQTCLEFYDEDKAPLDNGVEVVNRFQIYSGDLIIYNATSVRTAAGEFVGCVQGWFYNDSNDAQWFELTNGEFKLLTTNDPDSVAMEMARFISSNNHCTQSYVGYTPLVP